MKRRIALLSVAAMMLLGLVAASGPVQAKATDGAMIFEELTTAMCDTAEEHDAVCVDVRPVLNGPTLDQNVDENSSVSMQAVADALLATGLPELTD